MFSSISRHFRQPRVNEIMERELQEARIALLQAETAVEYSNSAVTYNRSRIQRLEKKLNEAKILDNNDAARGDRARTGLHAPAVYSPGSVP